MAKPSSEARRIHFGAPEGGLGGRDAAPPAQGRPSASSARTCPRSTPTPRCPARRCSPTTSSSRACCSRACSARRTPTPASGASTRAGPPRYPGVPATLVGSELPIPFGILPVSQDEHALALDKVRFVGDPVAAVAAIDEETAEEALKLIDVDYEILPAPHVHRRGAGPPRRAHPRVRPARQRAQGSLLRLRQRRGGIRGGGPHQGGHLLLRRQHPPADGAALRRWPPTGRTAS